MKHMIWGMCRDLHYSLGVPQDAIKRKSCQWKQVFESSQLMADTYQTV
jgi:hypothetical protein